MRRVSGSAGLLELSLNARSSARSRCSWLNPYYCSQRSTSLSRMVLSTQVRPIVFPYQPSVESGFSRLTPLCPVFQALPVIFIRTRHFSISNDGLIFIGIGIGAVLATVVNLWFLRTYPLLLKQWHGYPPAEERLYSAMVGGPILVIGIFWLGWSGNYASVPWWVPGLSTILIGLSITLIFISFIVRLSFTQVLPQS